ncbi:Uma2 family endonuclease [Granulicella cerasi]|uniref:Uma2 family endonuclease n=1 Tax=Granulicella cerasi TaxID=741063 RepID=A0ABW1ZBE5_9BACT|nr:Uma2 family endonuclease [Granulicella cerasi]
MAAAMTTPFVSVDEYLRTSYSPDVEYLDGVIEERNLGEFDHSDLQRILTTIFGVNAKAWGIKALPELRTQVAPMRYRVPDLLVIEATRPRTPIIKQAPLLCIEILSPEDRWPRMEVKLRDYFEMGVPEVWVFDPESRSVIVVKRDGSRTEHREGALTLSGTPVQLSLAEVFAVLDEG